MFHTELVGDLKECLKLLVLSGSSSIVLDLGDQLLLLLLQLLEVLLELVGVAAVLLGYGSRVAGVP